jgi:hypothetical protein
MVTSRSAARPSTTPSLGSTTSALEAICVSPQGTQQLQLIRQLTAAALNCLISGDLSETCAALLPAWATCNTTCQDVNATTQQLTACIDLIDDFNNGVSAAAPGCHEQPLVGAGLDFDPPGPAGSSKACNAAIQNDVEVTD